MTCDVGCDDDVDDDDCEGDDVDIVGFDSWHCEGAGYGTGDDAGGGD